MDSFLQIVFSGLTLGAMYALSAVGLTLLWGVVGMLNMSQGVMLAIGGYASYSAIIYLGLPWPLGLPAAIFGGFITGVVFYYVIVRWMYRSSTFEVGIIIATVGAAIVLESLMIRVFSGYPLDQPFSLPGGFRMAWRGSNWGWRRNSRWEISMPGETGVTRGTMWMRCGACSNGTSPRISSSEREPPTRSASSCNSPLNTPG